MHAPTCRDTFPCMNARCKQQVKQLLLHKRERHVNLEEILIADCIRYTAVTGDRLCTRSNSILEECFTWQDRKTWKVRDSSSSSPVNTKECAARRKYKTQVFLWRRRGWKKTHPAAPHGLLHSCQHMKLFPFFSWNSQTYHSWAEFGAGLLPKHCLQASYLIAQNACNRAKKKKAPKFHNQGQQVRKAGDVPAQSSKALLSLGSFQVSPNMFVATATDGGFTNKKQWQQ